MKQLRISGKDYHSLKQHLYPGDNKEAIAFALCGISNNESEQTLLVQEIFKVPYDVCKTRTSKLIEWPPSYIESFLQKANSKNCSVIKIHSHPTNFTNFSELDDECDKKLFRSIFGWIEKASCHASAVMLPDGKIFGRFIDSEINFTKIDRVSVCGNSVTIWDYSGGSEFVDQDLRNLQTFGMKTTKLLKKLKIGVVGCSGTGSIVIEQLVRLGVGEIVMIDPEPIEKVNLNRILNSIEDDALQNKLKIDILKDRLSKVGFNTKFRISNQNICESREDLKNLASCDFIFGCVDAYEPRYVLNQLSTYYLIPYIDVGVELKADNNNGITKVYGAIHYIQPKGSSLISREAITLEKVDSENMRRKNPDQYNKQVQEKYITNAGPVESPAVISINMQLSSMAVNEFLNKIDPFKSCSESENSIIRVAISDNLFEFEPDGDADEYLVKHSGFGDKEQFIGIIGL